MYDLLDDREHYQAIFTNMGESILFIQNMRFTDCNPAAIEMFRCSKGDLIGADVMVLSPDLQIDGNDSKVYAENKIGLGLAGQPQRFEWRFQRLDGEEFDGEVMLTRSQRSGDPTMIAVVRDISDRKNAEKDAQISRLILEQRARYDSLTGLRNRDSFHYDVSKVLEGKSGEETSFAVFLLDLNRFKEVNDTLGHKFGDLLLVQVAERLADLCREEFSAYRLGGDEFVVSGPTGSARDAEQIAVQIARELKAPFDLDNIKLQLDGSIGIALYPQHGEDSHSLLRSADVAMYQAKQKASGQAVYDKANDSHNERRLTLMTELANAIEASQLSLHYQPQIDIHSGNCIGCEALLRWEHPTHGRIPPDEFIPIAELNTVIHDLTFWVLTAAIEQISAWRAAQVNLNISVNISALSLMDANFVDRLKALLSESRLPTSCLTLEITESALIGDPDRAYRVLHGLQEQGVSIAIDDFGTGYSSLSYLKRLPVHTLKIDRSFVRGLIHNDTDATIVRSVIELSKSFGLKSVAEGVEDGETQAMLASLGCDYAQGYHFCRPVPGKEFLEWYNNR
ncbi:MAG: sensor domain-containing protein [bacterium]